MKEGKGRKVIVGMSGGVDSSVCALLLRDRGYDVIGVTYDFWHDDDDPEDIYRNLSDASEAKAVCDVLGIPHYAINRTGLFREKVQERFVSEYLAGRTPNPCIMCNPAVKWAAMLEDADAMGAELVSSGHYARTVKLENGRYSVKNSVTSKKDQTYVLCRLTQEQLARTIFPIGDYDKEEIRRIAAEAALPVAAKKDSQDVCFIGPAGYADYIRQKAGSTGTPGVFVTTDGRVLGPHKGTACYTVGQRRGLGLALEASVYVMSIDTVSGDVVLGSDEELYTGSLEAEDISYVGVSRFDESAVYTAKIRYSQKTSKCRVEYTGDDSIRVIFEEKVRAATPGQSLVLYCDDWVAGGAAIKRSL